MNDKTFLGFSCRIKGEQFITPSGKRVWAGIGQLKNALHYHATGTLKTTDSVEFFRVYESLEPYMTSNIIKEERGRYTNVSFKDEQ